jgi:hypothetical protein
MFFFDGKEKAPKESPSNFIALWESGFDLE